METPSPDHPRPQKPDRSKPIPYLEWYRLALLLTGVPDVAKVILQDAATAAADHLAQLRSTNAREAWLVRLIRERAIKWQNSRMDAVPPFRDQCSEGCSPETPGLDASPARPVWELSAALPEPDRSALALFFCLKSEPEFLAEMLGLRASAFADALARARQALVPSGIFPENPLVRVHRPWREDSGRILKAVRAASKSPKGEAEVASQTALDRRLHEEIEAVELPDDLALPEMAALTKRGFRSLIRQPAVLAIGLAILVVVGVVVFTTVRKLDDFPGKDTVAELIEGTDEMNGMELEPITPTEVGKLGDWFLLKGFEGFSVPPELAHAVAIGCRVYKHDGAPIAQVALDRQSALLLVFEAADLKVVLDSAAWHVFQQEDWAVAVRGDGKNCYVVTFLGDTDDMAGLLKATAGPH